MMKRDDGGIQQQVYDNYNQAKEQCDRLNDMWQKQTGR